jgi:hypothetical protein
MELDDMSKMGDWVIELQEDCIYLTREEFVKKHGEMFAYIYDEQLGIIPGHRSNQTRGDNNVKELARTPKDY